MSYANRLIYNNNESQEMQQLDSKSTLAYLCIIGALAMNPSSMDSISLSGTDTISPQLNYEIMLGQSKNNAKQQEIDNIKSVIISIFGLEIENHWLPNTEMGKECLYLQCKLDDTILSDYEKYSQLELDMYISTKEILDKSKFFDMVAMI